MVKSAGFLKKLKNKKDPEKKRKIIGKQFIKVFEKEAKKNKIEGRVIIQFVVAKDGSIKDATILRSVSPELDAEALRVINAMPNWKPGRQKGEPVNVKFTIPVTFKLQ